MAEKDNMKVNTSPVADVETGTAEDVEAIMKKYDRESNTRIWEGTPKQVIRFLLAAADIFPSSVHSQPTDFMVSPGCISLIHVSNALFRSLSDSGVLKFSVQSIFARLFNDWSLTLLS